jgi:HAMP domain-containing protein
MDMRTKLVLALVAVSLGSMFVLGAFTYGATRSLLEELALRQLAAVAESKKQDLEKELSAWRDRVDLIRSRTQLRLSLREYARSGSSGELERIRRILSDAHSSVRSVRRIAVFTPDGGLVAATGQAPLRGAPQASGKGAGVAQREEARLQSVALDDTGSLVVTYRAGMELDGAHIGAVEVLLSAQELVEITRDYTGLGETGETLVVMREPEGVARVLNPLRHAPDASLALRIPAAHANVSAVRALQGEEGEFHEGIVDYRGEPVWAATRRLPEVAWGVVVKVDKAEEIRSVTRLRETMLRLGLAVSAFAIAVGTVLGFYFARPIHELAELARRIRRGERDLRAKVRSEDEVGLLAEAFNQMTDELVEANRALEERIAEHERAGRR